MADLDQFISVVTNEAMQRVCYTGGGWNLEPYNFAVSETDILNGITVFDEDGKVTEEAVEALQTFTTDKMNADMAAAHVWHQAPFSGVTKASPEDNVGKINYSTLTHHIVIPTDANTNGASTKNIKTIYFIYQPKTQGQEPFLYGIVYLPETIEYETGVAQSFYFNFTMANSQAAENIKFTINYTYPSDIESHNTADDVHNNLLKRDGSRTITGNFLMYSGERDFTDAADFVLVSKKYVNDLISKLKTDNNLR